MILSLFRQQKIPIQYFWILFSVLLAFDIGMRMARYSQMEYQPRDAYGYVEFSRSFAKLGYIRVDSIDGGQKEILSKPPLLAVVMMFGERCGIDAELMGTVFVMICGILLPIVLSLIAHELFHDWRYTFGTMLLASVFPPLVRYSCLLLRDMPYWFFCSTAVWYAVRAEKKQSHACWILFGIVSALAVCTRREGMELLLAWGIWLCFCSWEKHRVRQIFLWKIRLFFEVLVPLLIITVPIQIYWNSCGSSWQILPLKTFYYIWSRLL